MLQLFRWFADKQYLNEDELRERKSIWERSLAEVKEHNEDFKTGKFTYRISLTQFSDLVKKQHMSKSTQ